jgi:hypothetical protein
MSLYYAVIVQALGDQLPAALLYNMPDGYYGYTPRTTLRACNRGKVARIQGSDRCTQNADMYHDFYQETMATVMMTVSSSKGEVPAAQAGTDRSSTVVELEDSR